MSSERYNPRVVEPHWQKVWDRRRLFQSDSEDFRPKYYVLEMFPYPSGRIHMGHVRNYAMGDVLARYRRARGYNVMHPMGWDAFGMPAENAAMQNKIHPKQWTYDNIATMRGQLKSMGLSLDWSREFATCDADYYAQQQRLFLDFLDAGLVARKTAKVNWDPGRPDRARQRAGDRRPRLALRRACRAARADPMVPDHHRLQPGPSGRPRPARPLARKSSADAEELDRPLGGPARSFRLRNIGRAGAFSRDIHDPARHVVRRVLHGRRARSPARGGARRRRSRAGGVHRRMPPHGHVGRRDRDGGEARLRHRAAGAPSLHPGSPAAGLCRQLHRDGIRHRRHLRLPGARPARPGFRPEIRAAGHPGGAAGQRRSGELFGRQRGLSGRRPHHQFRLPRQHDGRAGEGRRGDAGSRGARLPASRRPCAR